MSIRMIPTHLDNSTVALHAINRCFIRVGRKAFPELKAFLRTSSANFRYIGDLLVSEDRFLRNCGDYRLYRESKSPAADAKGPFIFIIAADTFSWHHVDKRLEGYLGYRLDELENDWVIAYHPDSYEETDEQFTDIIRSMYHGDQNYAELDIRYQTKSGHSVWAHQTMSLIRNWDGDPEYFLTVIRDTSMQQWTQLLYRELALLKELMEACCFQHQSWEWISGLLKHYDGESIEDALLHEISSILQE